MALSDRTGLAKLDLLQLRAASDSLAQIRSQIVAEAATGRVRWKQRAAPYSIPGKPKARRTSYATAGGYEWEISPTSKMPHVGYNHNKIGRYWQVVRDGAVFGSVHKTVARAKERVAEWIADQAKNTPRTAARVRSQQRQRGYRPKIEAKATLQEAREARIYASGGFNMKGVYQHPTSEWRKYRSIQIDGADDASLEKDYDGWKLTYTPGGPVQIHKLGKMNKETMRKVGEILGVTRIRIETPTWEFDKPKVTTIKVN